MAWHKTARQCCYRNTVYSGCPDTVLSSPANRSGNETTDSIFSFSQLPHPWTTGKPLLIVRSQSPLRFRRFVVGWRSTDRSPPLMSPMTARHTILDHSQLTRMLHLGLILAWLLGLWYWLSTGTRVVPTLIEMFRTMIPQTRIVAAEQLGQIGPAARAAIPQLLSQATQDGSQHANTTAATALKWIDLGLSPRHDPFHPAAAGYGCATTSYGLRHPGQPGTGRQTVGAGPLVAATHDADALVRRNALTALATIGIPTPARSARRSLQVCVIPHHSCARRPSRSLRLRFRCRGSGGVDTDGERSRQRHRDTCTDGTGEATSRRRSAYRISRHDAGTQHGS